MPWSGGAFTRTNGVNTGSTLWAQDRDDGTKILATRHDTNDQDMADGINSTLEKSGSNAATGNLDIGSNRITLVADGTAKTDVATVNQIQSDGPAFQATDTGTANTYVIALTPAITAYAAGQRITFKAGAASTTASTLNVNTLGTKAIKKQNDQDIASGDIETGSIVTVVYDGTSFQMTSQLASASTTSPGGSNTQVQYNSSSAFAGDADLTFDGTELTAAGINLAAFSGVLQANANFVDQVIFGPSVDGQSWNGAWSKASVFSSLMLATIEDEGSNTEINIWDLTTKANTTPLATIDLSAAATPTSIAASMGYLIVSSEDGIAILDPHSGAWAERTKGWPRTLTASTTPALTNADVKGVAAGFSDQPALDPRTGGPMPIFWVAYGTGADVVSLLKDDGNVWDAAGTIGSTGVGADNNGFGYYADSGNRIVRNVVPASTITADDWTEERIVADNDFPSGIFPGTTFDINGGIATGGGTGGLSFISSIQGLGTPSNADKPITSAITRAYNTGYLVGDIRGAWLANSKTVDRSYKANTLTENGTVTEAVVETSAELLGYSGFTASNNLSRASDADWDVITTGSVYMSIWIKTTTPSGNDFIFGFGNSATTIEFLMFIGGDGTVQARDDGATAQVQIVSPPINDNTWHKIDFVRVSSTERYLYIDGVQSSSSTTDAGSLSSSGNLPLYIGVNPSDGSDSPAGAATLSLAHLSVTAPSATQIRQMYDAERGLFVASAECLLQSSSTDAVLDVDVDSLSGKVIVTQTDAITIFDGLAIDSKPTVNSGASEKGKLWGDLRAEQNSANAYVTAPAVDQRQVNEMVRGLASDLPAGVDLSKAKAWLSLDGTGTIAINSSYNIKSVTDVGTGIYEIYFAIPFKSATGYVMAGSANQKFVSINSTALVLAESIRIRVFTDAGADADSDPTMVMFFGELENE
jgi:hypothetical protein